jgi:hypothetical protein
MDTNTSQRQQPIYFKLNEITGAGALEQIKTLTNQFDPKYGIKEDFVNTLSNTLTQTDNLRQGFLYAPKDDNVTRQVIGKGGCYFHLTTQNCAIHFIWHDRQTNKFLFWGDKFPLIRAMKIINSRIQKYSN